MKIVPLVLQGLCKWMARARLGAGALLAAGGMSGVLGGIASAQAQTTTPPPRHDALDLLPASGLALPRGHDSVDTRANLAMARSAARALPGDSASLTRAALVEMPADQIPGQVTRPKYALGFRSEGMKQFAKGMGLDADTCLAPLIRGRVSFTPSGDGSARLMVFARCSFH
jgi:hypothetical protein